MGAPHGTPHPAKLASLAAGDYSFAFSGLQLVLKVPALIVPVDVSIGGKLTQLAYSKNGNIGEQMAALFLPVGLSEIIRVARA